MRVAALGLTAAAALALTPSVATAPPAPVGVVPIVVSHPTGPPDRAHGFVAGNGLVVTVAHVLGGRVTVGGRRASVARVDRRLDLAVLRVPGVRGERPRLAENADANTVLGRPAPVVRRIAARVDGGPARPALELRADVSPGDSGAPLVTSTGRVAGVVFARSSSRPSTAYAVDASAVAQMLR
jgi:S1-C subfamily serine protease